uniref:Uncharacterized protein n=1 Tax=Rhizophora mucronata TaxID=61149 RepID=A0A2P2QJ95_RHIMU
MYLITSCDFHGGKRHEKILNEKS